MDRFAAPRVSEIEGQVLSDGTQGREAQARESVDARQRTDPRSVVR